MPRVLIPTDDHTLTLGGIVNGYRQLGWDVAVGAANLRLRAANYDVVHLQWPEEFTGYFSSPSLLQVEAMAQCLQWWKNRSRVLITVHNLIPHYSKDSATSRDLYATCFKNSHVITHFSEYSHQFIRQLYPEANRAQHVVHHPDGCEATLAIQTRRGCRRDEMNIGKDEFVLLVMGQIRSQEEMRLIRGGYELAQVDDKRLLMAGRLTLRIDPWHMRMLALQWKWWLKRNNARLEPSFLPEEELSKLVDSCDVVIVPRIGGLNSAALFAGMAFGRMIIAPDCGAFPEQLQGTRNLIYKTGEPRSLADCIEQAARLDTNAIGKENAAIASNWRWREICRQCLQ